MNENKTFTSGRFKRYLNYSSYSRKQKVIMLILLSLLFAATACLVIFIPVFTVKSENEAIIKIPRNADRKMVEDSISKYLGSDYAHYVTRAAILHNSDFSKRHGAYKIESGTTPFRAERKLSSGSQYPIKVVINGERTPKILAEKISSKLDFTPDSLLKAMENDSLLSKFGLKNGEAMALFPEATYEVYWNISPEQLMEKTADHYKKIWSEDRREKAGMLGLTPVQVMILCSIVDEETNKADDKGKIGRLYINRLQKGMKLQADPTVKYALGDFTLRRIRNEHTRFNSPYNTYVVTGLPPGPIRTTSSATIDSVLNSRPSTYIYMCAKDDFSGYHAFASTYDQHLKNARNYQKALNRRGIK